jgi:hypothetical protein
MQNEPNQTIAPTGEERAEYVPTVSLLSYLITVLAWEVELGVSLLHVLKNKKLDPLGHAALLAITVALTLFSWIRGKRDFQSLRHTRGRIPITVLQGVIITSFIIMVFGVGGGWILIRLTQ